MSLRTFFYEMAKVLQAGHVQNLAQVVEERLRALNRLKNLGLH